MTLHLTNATPRLTFDNERAGSCALVQQRHREGELMGLGPNGTNILPRIGVEPLSDKTAEELEEWMRAKQLERTGARAMGALKRREKAAPKPKVPKPRRHKHHCYCIAREPEETIPGLAQSQSGLECCRCKGATCLKPKKPKRPKATASTATLSAPVVAADATNVTKT